MLTLQGGAASHSLSASSSPTHRTAPTEHPVMWRRTGACEDPAESVSRSPRGTSVKARRGAGTGLLLGRRVVVSRLLASLLHGRRLENLRSKSPNLEVPSRPNQCWDQQNWFSDRLFWSPQRSFSYDRPAFCTFESDEATTNVDLTSARCRVNVGYMSANVRLHLAYMSTKVPP